MTDSNKNHEPKNILGLRDCKYNSNHTEDSDIIDIWLTDWTEAIHQSTQSLPSTPIPVYSKMRVTADR